MRARAELVEQRGQPERRLPAADDRNVLAARPLEVPIQLRMRRILRRQVPQRRRGLREALQAERDHDSARGERAAIAQRQLELIADAAQCEHVDRPDFADQIRLEPQPVLDEGFERQRHGDAFDADRG